VDIKGEGARKNSIGLNAAFRHRGQLLGFNYSTNNFLGLGETRPSIRSSAPASVRQAGVHRAVFYGPADSLGFMVY